MWVPMGGEGRWGKGSGVGDVQWGRCGEEEEAGDGGGGDEKEMSDDDGGDDEDYDADMMTVVMMTMQVRDRSGNTTVTLLRARFTVLNDGR
jgi:hypothetical protein